MTAKKAAKRPGKKVGKKVKAKPVEKPVVMRPGRNGGLLKSGGTISPGRPLDLTRQLMAEGLVVAAPRIVLLSQGRAVVMVPDAKGVEQPVPVGVKHSDQISAARFLYEVSAGPRVHTQDLKDRLGDQADLFLEMLPEKAGDVAKYGRAEIVARLKERVWV